MDTEIDLSPDLFSACDKIPDSQVAAGSSGCYTGFTIAGAGGYGQKKKKYLGSSHLGGSCVTNIYHRFTVALLLGALALSETIAAATMPAGSRVWMVHTSSACTGSCNTSNRPGPGGIPLTTFAPGNGSWSTGSAEMEADTFRSYVGGYTGSFMYLNMNDTYTVHGIATEPVAITAYLTVEGYARSYYLKERQYLIGANVQLEIGTLNPTTESLHEQWRITPYNDSTWAQQSFASEVVTSAVQFSHPINVSTSYTRMVNMGDVFDMGFGVTSALSAGYVDLLNTALVTFDLPEGVYLTSALGATFGTPVPVPVPAAVWLFGSGVLGLVSTARRKQ